MDEMKVEIGVKESFKRKLARSTWAGHVDKMVDEKLSRQWRGNGGEEDQNCDGACIVCDLERVGEE